MIDAVVTGRSLPALQSALDLAEVGLRVVVLDDTAEAPEPWAERDPDGVIGAFAKRIAAAVDHASGEEGAAVRLIEVPASSPLLLHGIEWLPQAEPNVLGIPAVPLAAHTSAVLGSGGAFRAYLDRLTPLLTVGKTRMLGELVRKRMGEKTLLRLVDPQVFERFGVAASQVEAAIAAPGLNEALSRAGSLGTAVLAYADRNVARETRVTPARGAANFANEVLRRLELYGVELRGQSPVSIAEEGEGWVVQLEGGEVLSTRALVVDLGDSATPSGALHSIVQPVLPREARVYATMAMQRPEWLGEGSRAIARVNEWSITIDTAFDLAPSGSSELLSETAPVKPAGSCLLQARSEAWAVSDSVSKLAEARSRESAGAALGQIGTGIGIGWLSGASLQAAVVRAAPYRTVAERNDAGDALTELETALPSLAAVGRSVHGDDQAVALSSAHVSAVRLRRRLLGLAE